MKNWIKNILTFIILFVVYDIFISITAGVSSMTDEQMLSSAKLFGDYALKIIIFTLIFAAINATIFKKPIKEHNFLKKRSHLTTYYLILATINASMISALLGKIPYPVTTVLCLSIPAMIIAYSYTKNNEQKMPIKEMLTKPFYQKTKLFSPLTTITYSMIILAIVTTIVASANNLLTIATFQRLILVFTIIIISSIGSMWIMTTTYSKIFLNKTRVRKNGRQNKKR